MRDVSLDVARSYAASPLGRISTSNEMGHTGHRDKMNWQHQLDNEIDDLYSDFQILDIIMGDGHCRHMSNRFTAVAPLSAQNTKRISNSRERTS